MEIQVGKKMMVKVDEYEGAYSITQGYTNKEGVFAPEMCMKRNYETQDYTDKRALAVYFGKGEDGIKNLCALAKMILAQYESAPF